MLKKSRIWRILLLLVVIVMANLYLGCIDIGKEYYSEYYSDYHSGDPSGSETNGLKCSICGTIGNGDSEWHMVKGKLICLDCYTKLESSKRTTKAGSRTH